jgi:DME family drug/metabolite transporter
VSPLAVGASTMAVGGVLLFATSARSALAAIRDPAARGWLLVGAVGVVAYPLAFYAGMNQAGVAIGNVVALGSGPVFAAILEWLWERHRLTALWLGCTVVAVVGILLLTLGGHRERGANGSVPLGVALGLVAGLAYALYTYASSRAIAAGPAPRAVMGGMFGLGAVALLPVLLAFGAPLLQSAQSIGIAAYLAIAPMFVAYLLFGIGMRTLRSSTATTITLLEPVVATLLAVLVVGERLEPAGWIGLALILAGVTVLATARQPGKTGTSP